MTEPLDPATLADDDAIAEVVARVGIARLNRDHEVTVPTAGVYALSHVWTDGYGVTWACDAYDHGPFCRRCEIIDGAEIVNEAQRRLRQMWEESNGV